MKIIDNKHLNSISLLRIIATFMIVMVHFGQSLPLPSVLHKFVAYGQEGVTIFFLISGYVIAASLSRNSNTGNFYKRRFIRIVPIYFAVVLVNLIASLAIGIYPADVTHLGWFRYFLFIHAIVPTNEYFYWNNAAALWTMSAFAVFYLVAPFIHRLVKDSHKKQLGILVGGVLLNQISSMAYLQFSGIYETSGHYLSTHSAFSVFFEFLVGMYLYYTGKKEETGTLIPIVLIGVLGNIYGIDCFIVTALFGILMYCITGKNVICSERMNRTLSKLDEYSFSIYLGHTTVMFIMSQIQEIAGFSNMKLAVFDLIGCVILIPFLHELIEKQANKIKKKVQKYGQRFEPHNNRYFVYHWDNSRYLLEHYKILMKHGKHI